MAKSVVEEMLAEIVKTKQTAAFSDVNIERKGSTIVLPEGMTHETAIKWHERKIKEEGQWFSINDQIDCFPLEGALALTKAIRRVFGFASAVPTPGMFGDRPPTLVAVPLPGGSTEQAVWGRVEFPGIEGFVETGLCMIDMERTGFQVAGKVRFRDRDKVATLLSVTREILKNESLYKGQALRMNFVDPREEGFDPIHHAPKFMDLSGANRDNLVFPAKTAQLVDTALFTPLENTGECREAGIPLKRGILLEGPYGTGKTLTQYVAAKLATENGWTVIHIDETKQLSRAVQFARSYQPAMIIAEDIDRVDHEGRRNDAMNAILNTIDGIESKSTEIMVVLTTNHLDKISHAMLRPGRLDAVIPVRPPDAKATERLIRLYGRDLVRDTEDLRVVGMKLAGNIPAVIREVVERSKLAAICRSGGVSYVTATDLEVAADGMMEHLELLKPRDVDNRSPFEKGAEILAKALNPMEDFDPTTQRELAGAATAYLMAGEDEE